MKLIVMALVFFSCCFSVKAQKKIKFELSSDINFSTGKNKFKIYRDTANSFSLQHYSSKRFENPFLSFKALAKYPFAQNFSAGIQTGVFIFFNESHYLRTKRVYPAFPIQTVFEFSKEVRNTKKVGASFSPGIVLYKIDDFIYQVNNALIIDGELFFDVAPNSRVKIGWRNIQEWTKYEFELSARDVTIKHKFPLTRNAIYFGYGLSIR